MDVARVAKAGRGEVNEKKESHLSRPPLVWGGAELQGVEYATFCGRQISAAKTHRRFHR
jgi:hypothetical protein